MIATPKHIVAKIAARTTLICIEIFKVVLWPPKMPNELAVRPDAAVGQSEPALGWAASRLRYSKVFADLPRQVVIDFSMAGDGAALIQ